MEHAKNKQTTALFAKKYRIGKAAYLNTPDVFVHDGKTLRMLTRSFNCASDFGDKLRP
jgi:hypothetical protein